MDDSTVKEDTSFNSKSTSERHSNVYIRRGLALTEEILAGDQDINALVSKSNQKFKEGRYEEALTCYEQAIRIDENCMSAWYNRGSVLRKLKKYEEALSSYDKALELNPTFILAWRKKAEILSQDLNQSLKSIYCYEQIIDIDFDDYIAWMGRGFELVKLGRTNEALKSFEKIQGRIGDPFLKNKVTEMKALLLELQKRRQELEDE